MSEPLLSVCLITYNHKQYIKDAIDGVLMQKVNFSWELIIADDCSTDGTREILLEYKEKHPDFIKLILQKKNVGPAKNWNDLITAPKSKYIAYFEGDDYWIDPLKLQKQIDFLEANPEYGMCYTRAKTFEQNKNKFSNLIGNRYIDFEHSLIANPVVALTTTFIKDLYYKYEEEIQPTQHHWKMGDYPMWLWFAYNSKIKYFEDVTGVYRVLHNSASHSNDFDKTIEFLDSTQDIKCFFLKKYNVILNTKLKNRIQSNYLLPKFYLYFKNNYNIEQIYKEINSSKLYSWKFLIIRISRYSSIIRNYLKVRWS